MDMVIVAGRLGSDPEMRYMPDGTAVTNFSVATDRYRGADKPVATIWYRCALWGKRAEAANEWLVKGQKVFIRGQLTPDWETGSPSIYNRNDGTPGTSYELKVDDIEYGARQDGGGSSGAATPATSAAKTTQEEDDIPF